MAEAGSGWEDVCWICLQTRTEGPSTPLVYPCACPRPVHEACLAKWQLHCAGREEESCCRFCKQPLPHWRQTLKSRSGQGSSSDQVTAPLMSIQFHGQTYWLQVQTGEGGVQQFQADVKRLLDLNSEDDFDITFECQVPGEGGKLELHGLQAFDAAVYCASLTAAERMSAGSSTPEGQPGRSSSSSEAAEAADPPPGTPQLSQPKSARRSSSGDSLGGGASSSGGSSGGGSRDRASSSSGSSSAGSDSGSSTYSGQPSRGTARSRAQQHNTNGTGWARGPAQPAQQPGWERAWSSQTDSSMGAVESLLVTSGEWVRMGVQGLWEVANHAWGWAAKSSH